MSRIIAVYNEKGGTGKTTTVYNLAAGLHRRGKRVLVVDMDPQTSITTCYGLEQSALTNTLVDLFESYIARNHPPAINECIRSINGINLLPANINLESTEKRMVSVMSREHIMKRILAPIMSEYDYILLDCPPSLGMMTLNALAAANTLIIPVKACFLDVKGMELLLGALDSVIQCLNPLLKIGGVLVTMCDERLCHAKSVVTALQEYCDEYSRYYSDTLGSPFTISLFETRISTSVQVQDALLARQDIFTFNGSGKVARDYAAFTEEVLARGI